MSRMRLAGLHPDVRRNAEWALGWANFYRVPVDVTSGLRSWIEQNRLRTNFEQCVATGRFGKTRECRFPANRPGDSSHEFGLAWDSVTEPWAQEWWTHVRRLAGFDVPAGDIIHAQVPNWRDFV